MWIQMVRTLTTQTDRCRTQPVLLRLRHRVQLGRTGSQCRCFHRGRGTRHHCALQISWNMLRIRVLLQYLKQLLRLQ